MKNVKPKFSIRISFMFMCVVLMFPHMSALSIYAAQPIEEQIPPPIHDFLISGYYDYFTAHRNKNMATEQIILHAQQESYANGYYGAVPTPYLEWEFDVEESGLYNIKITYFPLPGTGRDIEISLLLNGEVPFNEFNVIHLARIWVDARNEYGVTITQDNVGNDIRPAQIEQPRWKTLWLTDRQGLFSNPFSLFLEHGTHTIRIEGVREEALVKSLTLAAKPRPISHEEYMIANSDARFIYGQKITFEAEGTWEKNSSELAPTSDTSDAGMSPASPRNIRLNSIGSFTWRRNGQTISWKVPDGVQDGFYQIAFRALQNLHDNVTVHRNLYINGEIPFVEAGNIPFHYNTNWQIVYLAQGLPIRLQAGDIITLKATTGRAQELLLHTNRTVRALNTLYRQIISVTTPTPDRFRDYNIEREIPNLIDDLTILRADVEIIIEQLLYLNGRANSQSANLEQLAFLMDRVIASPHTLPANLQTFKSRMDSMAALTWQFNDVSLALDKGFILSCDIPTIPSRPGFFARIWFSLQRLFYSFVLNYRDISFGEGDEEGQQRLRIWVSTGRDQAQIINRLLIDSFTRETGIPVEVQQVGMGEPILQAIMAGRAPDVVLMQAPEMAINLAIRGAVMELSPYLTDEIRNRFFPSAWVPFTYRQQVFAIPETMNFNMLFYRTDVFHELGISVPQTWDEFYHVVKILQNNNLTVAMPETDPGNPALSIGIGFFDAFLFQRGGQYYTDCLTRSMFDTPIAMEAFEEWVNLYRMYGMEHQIDPFNRMRSGEAPLVITGNNFYALLAGAAPELAGLWDFAPIPGTFREDGVLDRSTSGGGMGTIVLQLAEERGLAQEAFAFASWWTSPETQTAYGLEIESMLGVLARYFPASIDAFYRMGWTAAEKETIMTQWEWIQGIPLIPASYIVNRSLTSALRLSVDNVFDPRRALSVYNRDINREIERRGREFDRAY